MTIEETLKRLEAAANSVASSRNAWMWRDDLVQEVATAIIAGVKIRLDRVGLNWIMHDLLDKWMGTRRKATTVLAVALEMTVSPALPTDAYQLKEIYEIASPAQRRALFVLMTEGSYRKDGASLKERMRDSAALYDLRKKIA